MTEPERIELKGRLHSVAQAVKEIADCLTAEEDVPPVAADFVLTELYDGQLRRDA